MDARIEDIALSELYVENVQKLCCLKGIYYLTSLSLVCEEGDFRRFAHAESFMAFLGLIPSEWSSGDKRKQGGITKSGNTHLRLLLIQSSWHYRNKAPSFKRLIERWQGHRYNSATILDFYLDQISTYTVTAHADGWLVSY